MSRKDKTSAEKTTDKKKKGRHEADPGYRKDDKRNKAGQYQGYDLDKKEAALRERSKPWFWKILGISLLITIVILAVGVGVLLHRENVKTETIAEINEANTIDKLLDGHSNVTITRSYSHLADGSSDYTTTRQVRLKDNGNYFSYLKQENSDEDYKEVIDDEALYRYDDTYATYYGLIGDDYNSVCVGGIEGDIFQGNTDDRVENTKVRDDATTLSLSCEVVDGDTYATTYGFSAGDTIEKFLTIDNDTNIVLSEQESCDGEVFLNYSVEFDGKKKTPNFYQTLKKEKETRTCTIYSDYNGDDQKKYTYTFPVNVYFDVLDHTGYTVYMDEDGTEEFTEFQEETQNPETDLTLYVQKSAQ